RRRGVARDAGDPVVVRRAVVDAAAGIVEQDAVVGARTTAHRVVGLADRRGALTVVVHRGDLRDVLALGEGAATDAVRPLDVDFLQPLGQLLVEPVFGALELRNRLVVAAHP